MLICPSSACENNELANPRMIEETTQRSKRREISDGKQEDTSSIDRLGDLPDDILCRILASLSTRISVQTSVLARRWRSLWAHAPCLYFTKEHFKGEDRFAKHADIIHRVMFLHKSQKLNTVVFSNVQCNARAISCRHGSALPFSAMSGLGTLQRDIRLDDYKCDEDKSYGSYVTKFLDCLYNVKYLKLSGCYNEKVIVAIGSNVKFNNLTGLELGFAAGGVLS